MTAPKPMLTHGVEGMGDTQALLSELTRVKVLFQARALATVMGFPQPEIITKEHSDGNA